MRQTNAFKGLSILYRIWSRLRNLPLNQMVKVRLPTWEIIYRYFYYPKLWCERL
jgi:hypothetical protein